MFKGKNYFVKKPILLGIAIGSLIHAGNEYANGIPYHTAESVVTNPRKVVNKIFSGEFLTELEQIYHAINDSRQEQREIDYFERLSISEPWMAETFGETEIFSLDPENSKMVIIGDITTNAFPLALSDHEEFFDSELTGGSVAILPRPQEASDRRGSFPDHNFLFARMIDINGVEINYGRKERNIDQPRLLSYYDPTTENIATLVISNNDLETYDLTSKNIVSEVEYAFEIDSRYLDQNWKVLNNSLDELGLPVSQDSRHTNIIVTFYDEDGTFETKIISSYIHIDRDSQTIHGSQQGRTLPEWADICELYKSRNGFLYFTAVSTDPGGRQPLYIGQDRIPIDGVELDAKGEFLTRELIWNSPDNLSSFSQQYTYPNIDKYMIVTASSDNQYIQALLDRFR